MAADIGDPSEPSTASTPADDLPNGAPPGQPHSVPVNRRMRLRSNISRAIRRERATIAYTLLYGLAIVGVYVFIPDRALFAVLVWLLACIALSVVAKIARRERPAKSNQPTTSQLVTFALTFAAFFSVVFAILVLTSE